MRIETRKLGLAAFIKMRDQKLLEVDNGKFIFDSDKTESQWEVEYLNSCCHRHDTELIHLRKLLR